MNFDELLRQYKAQERPEDAMMVILDGSLLRFAAVWPRVPLVRLGEPYGESWEALWDCVHVDVAALAMLAGVPEQEGNGALMRLKMLRLIYPDGKLPEMVRKAIGKRVVDALKQDIR